jgi:hypothetical protein
MVGIFDLGDDYLTNARTTLSRSDSLSSGESNAEMVTELVNQASEAIERSRVLRLDHLEHQALHIVRPGASGTAYDYGSGSIVGLHIDNEWLRGRPISSLDNRDFGVVAINLGSSERYLLAVDRSAHWATEHLGEAVGEGSTIEEIKDGFFEALPAYPVLRVRVEPGQGYFCNPQSVIHDGEANDSGQVDVALLAFGHFSLIS